MKTYNFKMEKPLVEPKVYYKDTFTDHRNGIICVNPTGDLECFLNYIELLNLHRDKWVSYGYLDLGMTPLTMGPAFMHNHIFDVMTKSLSAEGVVFYTMPAVALLREKCNVIGSDLWAFREDLVKYMGTDKFTTADVIKRFWREDL